MMKKRALVMGAHGFIGRHVCRVLSRDGWSVTGIGLGTWSESEWRAAGLSTWREAEITEASLLDAADRNSAPELIVHCAGSGSVGFSFENPERDRAMTVGSTAAVLEYMSRAAPSATLIYPSSAAVYGVVHGGIISESTPALPVSPYGKHKLEAEELCRRYGRERGLRTAVVRLFSVYGPGLRKQLLFDACVKASRGENGFFGTGDETRDWLHVDDAVSLLLRAGEAASSEGYLVNGGTGLEVPVRDIVHEIFVGFGRADEPRFTGAARTGDPSRTRADTAKVRALGWAPRVDWREGVREYVRWFRENAGAEGP